MQQRLAVYAIIARDAAAIAQGLEVRACRAGRCPTAVTLETPCWNSLRQIEVE